MEDMHVILLTPPAIASKLADGIPYEISDLDKPYPTMVVDGMKLSGHYEDILGTDLLFERMEAGRNAEARTIADTTMSASAKHAREAGLFATSTKRLVFKVPAKRSALKKSS